MASQFPEPPPNVPRIVEVQDPGTGHYVVFVRMPTQLTAKYPDKPWGTAIEDIGLAKQDSDRFLGYTLVDVEPLKGSPDLYWIFQKLDGPVWTTRSLGQESLVPAKYRRLVTTTQTKQEVVPATQPSAITGDLASSVVQQDENTGKATKINTTETIAEDADPLVGQQFDPKGAIMDVSEQLVAEGAAVETGVNVSQSTVDPLGNGKAVKVTQTPRRRKTDGTTEAGWPAGQTKVKGVDNLTPAKYRGLITTETTVTQHELAAGEVSEIPVPATPTGDVTVVKHEKVNDWRYQREVTEEVIDESGATLDGGRTSQWGVLTSADRVVDEGDPVPIGNGIAEASINPFGNGKAEESVLYYPEPGVDGVIATLSDQDQDPEFGIITDIDKILVTNAGSDALASTLRASNWWVEKKGQDQHHTVLIASKIDLDSLPAPEEYWDSDSIRLPDRLLSIGVLWGEQQGGGNGAGYDEGGNGFSGSARASATASLSATIALSLASGFSGRTKVKITRSYMFGPPPSLIEPYNIVPVTGSVAINTGSKSAAVSVSKTISDTRKGSTISTQQNVGSSGRMTRVGPFLNGGVVPSGSGVRTLSTPTYYGSNQGAYAYAQVSVSGTATIVIPTSTPTSIASGQVVARYQVPKRWRLGVWIVETIEVYAP